MKGEMRVHSLPTPNYLREQLGKTESEEQEDLILAPVIYQVTLVGAPEIRSLSLPSEKPRGVVILQCSSRVTSEKKGLCKLSSGVR
jgi:hypothetical protein